MAAVATIRWEIRVEDASGLLLDQSGDVKFSPGAGAAGQRNDVVLTGSAFTALSVPLNAKALVLFPGAAPSLVLKSVTGDSPGVTLTPASNALGIPVILPLGATPSVGILNNGSTVICSLIWL